MLHQIAGVHGAMAGLMVEVVKVVADHVRTHLADSDKHPGTLDTEAVAQLIDVVRAYQS